MNEKSYPATPLGIKSWAEADRPREKLLLRGRQALTDAELLAILLGSGSRRESALGLAQRLLQAVDNDLNQLGKCTLADLMKFHGIGEAKAITITAALEIGRRRQLTPLPERPQIRSSADAYRLLAPLIAELPYEECWMLCLNRANRVIHRECLSSGGTAGTVVDAKVMFRRALERKAVSLILAHNHPSGERQPSQADCDLTSKLTKAGKTLDMLVLDHLIITEQGYFSFADEGRIA